MMRDVPPPNSSHIRPRLLSQASAAGCVGMVSSLGAFFTFADIVIMWGRVNRLEAARRSLHSLPGAMRANCDAASLSQPAVRPRLGLTLDDNLKVWLYCSYGVIWDPNLNDEGYCCCFWRTVFRPTAYWRYYHSCELIVYHRERAKRISNSV